MARWYSPVIAAALTLLLGGCGDGLLEAGGGGGWSSDRVPGSDAWLAGDGGGGIDRGGDPVGLRGGDGGAPTTADAGGAKSAKDASATSCPRVEVDVPAGKVLNVRASATTSSTVVGTLADATIADVLSIVSGQTLDGVSTWYRIRYGKLQGYIWSKLAKCTTQRAPVFNGFYLPLSCGKRVKVTQGNFGSYSHTGLSAYAFDFSLGIGTKMVAMAPGVVSYVYNKTKPGDPCYSGGGPSCITKANIVRVKHPDGTQTIYAHLSKVLVSLHQKVARAQAVGLSGSSGYSTGPHAHVARIKSCCQSIPLKFKDVAGSGVPKTGDYVTSGNCP